MLHYGHRAREAQRVGRWSFALQLEPDTAGRRAIAATLERCRALLRARLDAPI